MHYAAHALLTSSLHSAAHALTSVYTLQRMLLQALTLCSACSYKQLALCSASLTSAYTLQRMLLQAACTLQRMLLQALTLCSACSYKQLALCSACSYKRLHSAAHALTSSLHSAAHLLQAACTLPDAVCNVLCSEVRTCNGKACALKLDVCFIFNLLKCLYIKFNKI